MLVMKSLKNISCIKCYSAINVITMHFISLGFIQFDLSFTQNLSLHIAYKMAQCNIETKLKELASLLDGCKTSLSEIEKGDNQQRAIRICRVKLQSACSRLVEVTKNLDDLFYAINISKDRTS